MEQASGIPSRNSKNIFGCDPTSVDLLENAWLSENLRSVSQVHPDHARSSEG